MTAIFSLKIRSFTRCSLLALLGTAGLFLTAAAPTKPQKETDTIDRYFLQNGTAYQKFGLTVDDLGFVRRAWLDITGRVPEPQVVDDFLSSTDPDKRALLIDDILETQAYVGRWTTFFEDIFFNQLILDGLYRNPFHFTLRNMVAENVPWNEMARTIITDNGTGTRDGSAFTFWAIEGLLENFRLDFLDDQVGVITDAFLGLQTTCISCHDGAGHLETINKGLTPMKREQFWGMAAFLSQAYFYLPGRNYDGDQMAVFQDLQFVDLDNPEFDGSPGIFLQQDQQFPSGEYVAQSEPGEGMRVPRNGGTINPRYLWTGEAPQAGETRRQALARMITADRQFARSMVNRVWAHFFGSGFVEPVNGWDLGRLDPQTAAENESTVQARDYILMELLTDAFIGDGYDMKALIRKICNSELYQLDYAKLPKPDSYPGQSLWTSNDRVRRLESEAIVDNIFRVLGQERRYVFTGYFEETFNSVWEMPDTYEPNVNAIPIRGGNAPSPRLLGYAHRNEYEFMQRSGKELMESFGRGDRFTYTNRDNSTTVRTTLTLMNDPYILDSILSPESSPFIQSMVQALDTGSKTREEVTREIFLRILFREPSALEFPIVLDYLQSNVPAQAVPDAVWALLNQPDFVYK